MEQQANAPQAHEQELSKLRESAEGFYSENFFVPSVMPELRAIWEKENGQKLPPFD